MMSFRIIKTGITNILNEAVESGGIYDGQFKVIAFQKELQSAEEVKGNNRTVQIYYDSGEFTGAINRDPNHLMTFKLDLIVGSSGKVDLAALDSATSDAERAAIIANFKESLDEADEKLDELIEFIYQIIMSGDNYELGVDRITPETGVIVTSRQIIRVQKNEPIPKGEYAVVSAVMTLTCRSSETLLSTTETPGGIINTDLKIENDDTGKAGIIVDNTI